MGLENVYQQRMLDHYHNPRNYGELDNPDFHAEIISPTCGDSVTFTGRVSDRHITQLAFHGEGSILSQATASILSEELVGMDIDRVQELDQAYIQSLIGLDLGPTRLQTAMLPLQVIQKGIASYVQSADR